MIPLLARMKVKYERKNYKDYPRVKDLNRYDRQTETIFESWDILR